MSANDNNLTIYIFPDLHDFVHMCYSYPSVQVNLGIIMVIQGLCVQPLVIQCLLLTYVSWIKHYINLQCSWKISSGLILLVLWIGAEV